jgi:hypothetical protein
MDPVTISVVTILGKYALDKGFELGKEVGPRALEAAEKMFGMVLERIGKKKPEMAADFGDDPETYQKPMEKAVTAEADADPEFKVVLEEMLKAYEVAATEYKQTIGQAITASEHSAVATDGGVAIVGDGNVAVTGGMKGDITVGVPPKEKD